MSHHETHKKKLMPLWKQSGFEALSAKLRMQKQREVDMRLMQCIDEMVLIDHTEYIPLDDYFYMVDHIGNPEIMLPLKFVESTKKNPEDWKMYVNDTRPFERF